VSVKTRVGYNQVQIDEWIPLLLSEGIAALTVHARTRKDLSLVPAQWDYLKQVVAIRDRIAPETVIIGNGDVTTPESAAMMFEETGCAGVSIGRGAFYNPWIFLHTREFLQMGVVPPEPSFEERIRVMCRHLDLMVEIFGEVLGCRMFRKVAPWYSKRFGPANEFNKKVVQVSSKAEFHKLLENYLRWRQQFLDLDGNLKPNYRPPPMVPSFMQEPAVAERTQIPVPKGPVEVW
jgi:tRNA-dihydrouridine synthase